jgi:D-galactonate transporter
MLQVDVTAEKRSAVPSDEDHVYRKVFARIVPLLMLCYVVAYLDRVNVGFAKLQMADQLHLSDAAYGLGAGIFFFGYFLFEVPSNIMLHRLGARVWITRIMITWGIVSAGFMFTSSASMFYVLRFLLGSAEAGFFPGIILYLTRWYPAHRRAKIITTFMSAIPVASIFGNPLSGFLMERFQGVGGLAGWQWLFVVEAVPAVILGVVVYCYLDDDISSAKWLNPQEKAVLDAGVVAESQLKTSSPMSVGAVLSDSRVWLMCLIYFCVVLGQYGLNFWLPTIVKTAGVSGNLTIGLISAVPYVCTFIVMILLGRSSDHFRERRWHIVVPAVVAACGFAAVTAAPNPALAVIALSVAAAGCLSCAPLFWALPTAFLSGAGAAAGIAWINSVGNLAGFLGPFLVGYLKGVTGNTGAGMYLLAAALIVGSIAVLTIPAKSVNR